MLWTDWPNQSELPPITLTRIDITEAAETCMKLRKFTFFVKDGETFEDDLPSATTMSKHLLWAATALNREASRLPPEAGGRAPK